MIITCDFVFVLPPKCASTSISYALRDVGIHTQQRHEPLLRKPPHPLVAAVVRDYDEMVQSATANGTRQFIAYGKQHITALKPDVWLKWVTFPLRFEHLQEDWQSFCTAANLGNIELPHYNKRRELECS